MSEEHPLKCQGLSFPAELCSEPQTVCRLATSSSDDWHSVLQPWHKKRCDLSNKATFLPCFIHLLQAVWAVSQFTAEHHDPTPTMLSSVVCYSTSKLLIKIYRFMWKSSCTNSNPYEPDISCHSSNVWFCPWGNVPDFTHYITALCRARYMAHNMLFSPHARIMCCLFHISSLVVTTNWLLVRTRTGSTAGKLIQISKNSETEEAKSVRSDWSMRSNAKIKRTWSIIGVKLISDHVRLFCFILNGWNKIERQDDDSRKIANYYKKMKKLQDKGQKMTESVECWMWLIEGVIHTHTEDQNLNCYLKIIHTRHRAVYLKYLQHQHHLAYGAKTQKQINV